MYKLFIKRKLITFMLLFVSLSAHAAEKSNNEKNLTINYSNISILEYLKFVSRITEKNFIYNESDLNFTISVVSEAPVNAENIMGTLLQILRMHNMNVIEDGNNLVLQKGPETNYVAKVVSEKEELDPSIPLVTKLFRIKNANLNSVAGIVRQMISPFALLETSVDTRQLILTDITQNVEKISQLIDQLDSPHSPLEIEAYDVKNERASSISSTLQSIIQPISQSNPFIIVPQDKTNTLYIVSTPQLIEKSLSVLGKLDVVSTQKPRKEFKPENIFIYKPQNLSADKLESALDDLRENLESQGFEERGLVQTLSTMEWIKETNSFLFNGDSQTLSKLKEILATVDTPSREQEALASTSFFTYKPQNKTPEAVKTGIDDTVATLEKTKNYGNQALVNTLKSAKVVDATGSIIFTGNKSTFSQVEDLLKTIDVGNGTGLEKPTFFIYNIKSATPEALEESLKNMAKYLDSSKIEDKALIESINTMKYIPATNSIAFTGPQAALTKIQELLENLDGTDAKNITSKYIIYKPLHVPGQQLKASLLSTAKNLEESKLSDPAFIQSLNSVKYDEATKSLYITGDQASIAQIQELLKTLDTEQSPQAVGQSQTYILYQLQYVTRDSVDEYLDQLKSNLEKVQNKSAKEEQLIKTITTKQWVPESSSYMFYGTDDSLKEIQDLLSKYDVATHQQTKPTYFLYKLQHASGDVVEDNLHTFVDNLKKDSSVAKKYSDLIELIDNIRWIKETNSLMLTGSSQAIDEAKQLIADYDTETASVKKSDKFFIYKPTNISVDKLEKYLKQTAKDLDEAGLADPALSKTINSMKVNTNTKSVIFAGSESSLNQVKELLTDIDSAELADLEDQNDTFYIYKLQTASGPEVLKSLKGVSEDLSSLSKQSDEDKEFLETLNSAKYVEKTNSILFTGTPDALKRVKTLVENFDVSQLAAQPVAGQTYFVYKPKSINGEKLKETLEGFAQNLKENKVSDPNLYKTLEQIRWDQANNSLIFTGTPDALDKTKELLATFDVPTKDMLAEPDTAIAQIDDTSFLVYKLQYHNGEEIQGALRAVGREMLKSGSPVNKQLLDTISSIQLIPMTNSLLCSGTPDTLKRLKELIRNLDIPLNQVFIEMLIIETSFNNVLNFGLNWAGKVNYKNRGVASINNIQEGTALPQMFQNLDTIDASNMPTGSDIPFGNGFDLGIIGDIVLHKGRTFISLGSLVSALQADGDTTIVSTPKLITQDSKTSEIFIGQNVPFVGSFVSNQTANTLSTQNLEYRDIGIKLALTPVLGNSDIVTLKLQMDRSEQITGPDGQTVQTTFSNVSVTGITTSKTTMNTTVHIPNKNFLVLSGMVDTSKVRTKAGIPCLGGLPVIGAAFSESNSTEQTRNIVIFIRPHIISSYQDMVNITKSQEDFFRDYSGSIQLESDFEEAMEMIKTIDDD